MASTVKREQGMDRGEEEEEESDVDMDEEQNNSNSEEDEEGDDTAVSKSKRKVQDDSDYDDEDADRLEDDDYDLLEENTGIRFKKKFRRVKVLDDDDSDDASTTAGTREQIAEELFDLDDDAETTLAPNKTATASKVYSSEESSEDEIDDFIVDDSGVPVQKRKRRRGIFVGVGDIDATDERLQSAQDIFGVDFEVEDLDGNVDDDDSEDEGGSLPRSKLPKKTVTLEEIYEPAVLENMNYSEKDIAIRETDIPERFQRHGFTGLLVPLELMQKYIKDESVWIYDELIRTNELIMNPIAAASKSQADPTQPGGGGGGNEAWDEDRMSSVAGFSAGNIDANSTLSTSSAKPIQPKAAANDDDDWELPAANTPKAVERANNAWNENATSVGRVPAGKPDAEDEWDSAPAAIPPKTPRAVERADDGWDDDFASSRVKKSGAKKPNDDDEWGAVTAPAIPSKANNAVEPDTWGDDDTLSSVSGIPAGGVFGAGANSETQRTTNAKVNAADDDDEWYTPIVNAKTPQADDATSVWGEETSVVGVPVDRFCTTASEIAGRSIVSRPAAVVEDTKAREAFRIESVRTIAEVLLCMKKDYMEVPFIIQYKKDMYQDKLLEKHLWLIYHLDIKYTKLYNSIKSLQALATSTCSFLSENKNEEWITNTFGVSYRKFSDNDVSFISSCKSFEELSDYRSFYSLHYGKLTPIMKSLRRKQKLASEKDQPDWDNDATSELNCSISQLDPTDGLSQLAPLPANETLRVIRVSKYERLYSELRDVVDTIGITMSELAINIVEEYSKHKKEPPTIGSEELAQLHLSTRCPSSTNSTTSTTQVLEGMKTILATQLSREPSVKRILRNYILNPDTMCTLTVFPTEKGVKVIDEFHMLFPLKYVTNKKISDFKGECFLKLLNGEQDKLLEVRFSSDFTDRVDRSIVKSWCSLYKEDGCSLVIQDWNRFRESVIENAVLEILLPEFLKEVKSRLETEAKDFVAKQCRKQIRNIINVGKIHPKAHYESDDASGIRVMGIAYEADPGLSPFACVMKSGGSELLDYCTLGNLMLCHRSNETLCSQLKTQIAKFLLKNKPHFIVIGGESLDADNIADLVREAAESLRTPKSDPESESDMEMDDMSFPEIQVVILPNSAAKVYSLSKLAMSEYGEYPIILRQAISLARSVLDPLVELGQLYNSEEDILCINFHPFQAKVDKQKLLDEMEEEFVCVVNTVGVEFNECLKDPRKGHMLQFICGLGPAKAAFLLRIFRRKTTGLLLNREQLHSIGKLESITFANCAGFIRINVKELENGSDDVFLEYLDSTRIHPNNYVHARFIAHDAMAVEDDNFDESVVEVEHVQKILDDPEKNAKAVKELSIEDYNAHLMEAENLPNMKKLLDDIVQEFCAPFKDPRPDFKPPSAEETFYFLTKETPETFYVGKLLNAKVVGFSKNKCKAEMEQMFGSFCITCGAECYTSENLLSHVTNPKGIHIMLDNGVRGYIHTNMLSDQQNVKVKERVKPGQVIVCRIFKFDPEKRMVQLTSRSSDLRGENEDLRVPKDPDYDESRAQEEESKLMKAPQAKTSGVVYHKRAIAHACFYNITYQESKSRLDAMDNADAIFRPSSKGPDHLTLSWKVMDRVIQHVDIIEQKQQDKTVYIIEEEEYEDLDEILSRYVYAIASLVRDLTLHKNFIPVSEGCTYHQLELILQERYTVNPRQMPYILTPIRERPGRFLLSYVMGGSIKTKLYFRHEPIRILPDGFFYRHACFDSLSKLLSYFKRHFRDTPPTHTPMIGSSTVTGSVQLF